MQCSYINPFNISYFSLLKHRFCLLNSSYYLISTSAIQSFSDMVFINGRLWSVIVHLKKVGMNIAMRISLTNMICCFYAISVISSSMSSIFPSCKNKFTYLGQFRCQIYYRLVVIMHKVHLCFALYHAVTCSRIPSNLLSAK